MQSFLLALALILSVVFALPSVYEVHVGTTTRENKLTISSIPSCSISSISNTFYTVKGDNLCFETIKDKGLIVKRIEKLNGKSGDDHYVPTPIQIGEIAVLSDLSKRLLDKKHYITIEFTFSPESPEEVEDLYNVVKQHVLDAGCSSEFIEVKVFESLFGSVSVYHGAPQSCKASTIVPVLNDMYVVRIANINTVEEHFNYWGNKVLQTGVLEPSSDTERYMQDSLNYDGTGETIGIGDTGLDTGHCSFYDTNSVPYHTSATDCTSTSSHRKILCYVNDTATGDDDDFPADHGTHVAGTAAGLPGASNTDASSIFTPNDLRGAAPGAKIWFHDLQACSGTSAEDCPGLSNPEPFGSGYFKPAYDNGVRVYSSSWGRSDYYVSNARQTDIFVWSYRDMVVLFANGNSAHDADQRTVFHTVGSPADAKNIIGVGAARSPQIEWKEVCEKSKLKSGAEATLCSQAVGSGDYSSKVLANFSSQGPTVDGRIKPDLVAPGDPVISAKSGPSTEPHTCSTVTSENNYRWLSLQGTSMATPMLAGNTILLRQYLKDAAGTVATNLAAKSFNANPDYFPSAALVRGLLTLNARPLEKFLIKPLIESLTLGDPVNINRNTLPFPSPHYGFGMPDMKAALSTENAAVLSLMDEGTIPGFTDSDEMRVLKFNVPTGYSGRIEAVLSWLDYAGPESDGRLVHDLDLIVMSASGRIFVGNHGVDGTTYALRKADRFNVTERILIPEDLVSDSGDWYIIVHAYHIQTSKLLDLSAPITVDLPYPADVVSSAATIDNTVPFSLVFKGPEHPTLMAGSADLPDCPNSCWASGYERGTCNVTTKRCECNEGWTGLDCSHKVTELELGQAEFFDIAPYDRLLFKFTIDPPPAGVNTMNLGFRARSGPNQQNLENWPSKNYIPWGKANTDVYVWRSDAEPKPAEWDRIFDGSTLTEYAQPVMKPKDSVSSAYSVQQRSGGADTNRVYIEDVEPGTYFALVVNKDPIARGMLEVEAVVNPCSQACNAAGSCAGNVCMCYDYYYGATCSKGTGNGAWRPTGMSSIWLVLVAIVVASVATML